MNKIRPLWLCLGMAVLVLVLVLETRQRTQEVHTAGKVPALNDSFSLFVPSPYELMMINAEKDLWPRRFGPKQPPASSDLPVLYSLFLRKRPLQRDEIDFFRTIAMTSSLGEWDTFRDILSFRVRLDVGKLNPSMLLQWIKNEKCSNYGQEIGFRLVQWDPTKLKAVRDVFAGCDPDGFHTLWFEILLTVEKNNMAELTALRDRVQARRQNLPNDSFVFFLLTQVFETLDMKVVHGK